MRSFRRSVIAFLVWAAAVPAVAQTTTATLAANLPPLAKLTVSSASVSFPDADPELVQQIPASGGPLLITAKARATAGAAVVLSVQAADDLRSGLSVIAASNVTWTASGTGFVPGTLSKTSPATVATWTGSGTHSGSQQFFLRNLWTHPTGIYTLSMIYTLSAP